MFFFKQKTAYEIASCLVGSEMCIRDRTTRVSSTEDTLANIKVKWEGEIPHPLSFPAWLGIDLEGDDLDIKATLRSRQRDISHP